MKKGFTLAEVLIAIVVIGLVAMLTVPMIVQNYKKRVATTRLKKFYSTMQQAIALSEIENHSVETWQRAGRDVKNSEGEYDYSANAQSAYDFFMKYLAPYMNYVKAVQTPEKQVSTENMSVYLADGSVIIFHNGGCVDLYYDINGEAKPNARGRDIFVFAICEDKNRHKYLAGQKFGALVYLFSMTTMTSFSDRATALENCKSQATYCAALLMFDDFEFKDDYPYKL